MIKLFMILHFEKINQEILLSYLFILPAIIK